MSKIAVGTCGYGYYDAPKNWKDKYQSKLQAFSHDFKLLEIQKTFYKLPRVSTCEKWKRRSADDFVFTMKAWQALTHPLQSPTWRGNDDHLTDEQRQEFGYLRPHPSVKDAWDQTFRRARALDAPVVVIQCPARFEPSRENENNMRELLSSIERHGIQLAWEPRGDWLDQPERVASLCEQLDLIHTVDLHREKPFYVDDTTYVRMHGLNENRYDYDYDYSERELDELANRLEQLADSCDHVYCLFNNFHKFDNARSLMTRL